MSSYCDTNQHFVLKCKIFTTVIVTERTLHYIGYSENHLNGCFCLFAPKLWEGGRDLWMIFCLSVRAVWVVSTVICGGDTQTLTTMIEFIRTFVHSETVVVYHALAFSLWLSNIFVLSNYRFLKMDAYIMTVVALLGLVTGRSQST